MASSTVSEFILFLIEKKTILFHQITKINNNYLEKTFEDFTL